MKNIQTVVHPQHLLNSEAYFTNPTWADNTLHNTNGRVPSNKLRDQVNGFLGLSLCSFWTCLQMKKKKLPWGMVFPWVLKALPFQLQHHVVLNPLVEKQKGSSGFCFCGDLGRGLGLKHFMVELGWQTRAAREAAIRHLSTMFVFVKVTIAVHQSALKRFLKLRFKYDSQTYQLHPNAIKSWPSKLFIIPVVCRTM